MKHIIIGMSAYYLSSPYDNIRTRNVLRSSDNIHKHYGVTHYKYEIIGFISWQGLKNKKAWKHIKEIYDFRTYRYLGIDK